MTPTDHYHHDCAHAERGYHTPSGKHQRCTRDDLDQIWRTYQRALFLEIEARSLRRIGGPTMRNRPAIGDDTLPVPFGGYWRHVTDMELMALYDTLIDADYRPRRKRSAKKR